MDVTYSALPHRHTHSVNLRSPLLLLLLGPQFSDLTGSHRRSALLRTQPTATGVGRERGLMETEMGRYSKVRIGSISLDWQAAVGNHLLSFYSLVMPVGDSLRTSHLVVGHTARSQTPAQCFSKRVRIKSRPCETSALYRPPAPHRGHR